MGEEEVEEEDGIKLLCHCDKLLACASLLALLYELAVKPFVLLLVKVPGPFIDEERNLRESRYKA